MFTVLQIFFSSVFVDYSIQYIFQIKIIICFLLNNALTFTGYLNFSHQTS